MQRFYTRRECKRIIETHRLNPLLEQFEPPRSSTLLVPQCEYRRAINHRPSGVRSARIALERKVVARIKRACRGVCDFSPRSFPPRFADLSMTIALLPHFDRSSAPYGVSLQFRHGSTTCATIINATVAPGCRHYIPRESPLSVIIERVSRSGRTEIGSPKSDSQKRVTMQE